jgi:HK97 family phage portal protein
MILEALITSMRKKGLYDLYPELRETVHVSSYNSEDGEAQTSGDDLQKARNSYETQMWVQKAIKVLADNIAPLPFQVATPGTDGNGGEKVDYVTAHPVIDLLNNPNPDLSGEDLNKELITNLMLGGECGYEMAGAKVGSRITEIWPRQADTFTVRPKSVRYRQVDYYRIDDREGEPFNVYPDRFVHFKFFNPRQPFRGLAPITAIRLSIGIDQLAQAWSMLFFKNSARPDFAIIAPEGITPTERKELLIKFKAEHGGANAHEPIILEQGITDIKTFSFAPKDMEWLTQRQYSRQEIGAIFGVPDEIMGFGKDTYQNMATAEGYLWNLTIIPLLGLRDGRLTRFFRQVKLLRPNQSVVTDLADVKSLRDDIGSKVTQFQVLVGATVPPSIAAETVGLDLDRYEGDDIGYISSIMVPLGTPQPEPAPVVVPVAPEPAADEEPAKILSMLFGCGSVPADEELGQIYNSLTNAIKVYNESTRGTEAKDE